MTAKAIIKFAKCFGYMKRAVDEFHFNGVKA
jgi:hypothetical protein